MTRLFVSLSIAAVVLVNIASAPLALAQSTEDAMKEQLNAAAGSKGAGYDAPVDPRDVVLYIIGGLLTLTATILLALMVYAGIQWMTAGGNEEQVTKAKTTIKNATLGLIVVVFSYAITLAITNLAQGNPVGYGADQDSGTLEDALFRGLR